ncbi:MAG: hypothetical protein COV35_00560 [Alphaproteobacteria bacterium CG11_big_fil_rev_8_21_14_0_20_39_49]|nr:MAG: hypothetical protein COV35_00560 [Alphaproteobacteria bacterium CG11_big_fil_rev_8_21_14_0_20_39_49]
MSKKPNYYNYIRRWHFYAGVIICPVLLVMAITGGMYLMQPQIEDAMYGDKIYLSEQYTGPIDHDALITKASNLFNAKKIHTYQPPSSVRQSVQIILTTKTEDKITVFMHPQSGEVIGTIDEDLRLMNIAKDIHGGLMMGTVGGIIVELVACWTLVTVITGLYLWWSRGKKKRSILLPDIGQKGRKLWREFHAVTGAWGGLWIMAIIITGLPWSVVWGDLFSKTGHALNEGFPKEIFSERPHSISDASLPDISINTLMSKLSESDIKHSYKIDYPWFANGVFAVMPLRHGGSHKDVAYVFLDKRTGEVIKDLRWDNLGAFGKASSIGVQFHEGRLFGVANQTINLLAVIILIGLALTGPIMWWKRKPESSLGVPAVSKDIILSKKFIGLIVFTAIFLPLFGLSVIAIIVGEIIYKKWMNV